MSDKYTEAAMNIIDSVLDMVYERKPETQPKDNKSLIYGESYYHLEQIIVNIIKKTNPQNRTNDPVYGEPTHCSICKPPSNFESEDDLWICKNSECTNQNKLLTEG